MSEKPVIEKEAMLMYSGMTGVLSSSLPLQEVEVTEVRPGVCGYTASLPLTGDGLTLSWTMADHKQEGELTASLPLSPSYLELFPALAAVEEVLADTMKFRDGKTERMNSLLNTVVPYFRCSDEDIVKVYYFLWSLHLMYYKDPAQGMRAQPTTQTAVNNFLGLHRFDAVFQIMVGSWVNPQQHQHFANGKLCFLITTSFLFFINIFLNCR